MQVAIENYRILAEATLNMGFLVKIYQGQWPPICQYEKRVKRFSHEIKVNGFVTVGLSELCGFELAFETTQTLQQWTRDLMNKISKLYGFIGTKYVLNEHKYITLDVPNMQKNSFVDSEGNCSFLLAEANFGKIKQLTPITYLYIKVLKPEQLLEIHKYGRVATIDLVNDLIFNDSYLLN